MFWVLSEAGSLIPQRTVWIGRWHLRVATIGTDAQHDRVFLVVEGPVTRHLSTSYLQAKGNTGCDSPRRCGT
jgi:hypothetical protein